MNVGDKFSFKGFEWVALEVEDDKVTAIMTKSWGVDKFDVDNCNNWKTSTLRKKLVSEMLPVLGEENLVPHVTDLMSDDGNRAYGTVEDKVWLISCDEYRRWRDVILDNYDFDGKCMWTLTPWYINDVGYGNIVRHINPSGTVGNYYAHYSYGVAPACIFHLASLESAPAGAMEEVFTDALDGLDRARAYILKLKELFGRKEDKT